MGLFGLEKTRIWADDEGIPQYSDGLSVLPWACVCALPGLGQGRLEAIIMNPVSDIRDNTSYLPGGMRFDSNAYFTPNPRASEDMSMAFGDMLSALESSVIQMISTPRS